MGQSPKNCGGEALNIRHITIEVTGMPPLKYVCQVVGLGLGALALIGFVIFAAVACGIPLV